jgi:hypothetical protein
LVTTRKPVGAAGAVPIAGCEIVIVRPATVADVDRDEVPVCAATVNLTVPLPVPDAPDVILSHELCSEADQLQPVEVVTAKEAEPPARATDCDVGDTENVQGAPACVTVTDCPAIVSVLLRCDTEVFAVTEIDTVPLPLPLAPLAIVIQGDDDVADQAQPIGAVTENVFDPPDDPNERLVGVTAYVQGTRYANVLDGVLADDPVGPTAAILTSYAIPPAGGGIRIVLSATRIVPAPSGVGFPRFTTRSGVADPVA